MTHYMFKYEAVPRLQVMKMTTSQQHYYVQGMGPLTKTARIFISRIYNQAVAFLLAFTFTSTAVHPL